jgi:hypothetical protein
MLGCPMLRGLLAVVLLCNLLPVPAEAQFKHQGLKLVGTSVSPSGPAQQGLSVAALRRRQYRDRRWAS